MKLRLTSALFLVAGAMFGHPMGNFSVNHYARIETTARGAHIRYVLDLAEIPTFELLEQWKMEATAPRAELEARAAEQAREWVRNLRITVGGRAVKPHIAATKMTMDKGAADMPVMRVVTDLELAVAPGRIAYEDGNYSERAGWKEIVVAGRDVDRSKELTEYSNDPAVAPQVLRTAVEWQAGQPVKTVLAEAPAPTPAPAAPAPPATPAPAPGTVVKGDFLSQLLHKQEISFSMMLVGLAVAFGLGAVHALSPGHGKTIVAAYLVGTRGTPKHAAFLGAMVTFTHTISVFFLGFVTLFLSQYVLPEKIYPVLGAISGISIVWIGATMLYKRWQKLRGGHSHAHGHHHHHPHDHDHPHTHDHGDGHVHSHVPEGDVTLASLIALGASGGLVPCPSALVLLLSSIALGRVSLGLMLLVSFSAGLAVVLMAIGMAVLFARHLLPDSGTTARHPAFRVIPVLSAAVIVCLGLILTGVSLGVIRPGSFLSGV